MFYVAYLHPVLTSRKFYYCILIAFCAFQELGNSDDVGVLITNKPEAEILRKFADYQEFDFAEPGNTPMKTMMYTKDHVLSLPPHRSSAKSLFPILQKLGMPVELIGDGEIIKLTEDYIVCEERVRVTEKASKILVCF
ncbi:hypothetical protein MKW98_005465 [Papaver atlanticum]|uniref:Uncharacterized protein n=1 Tax=Papaver atlanticum TaxID=357466 RepID=A0AAD4T9X5_9MAGN|nr:hypothetical protein MKW98_005465 [Papaver atlanticum]